MSQYFISFFLPEGILDWFEIVKGNEVPLEKKKDEVYNATLHIYLDERDNRTPEMLFLRPNGFTEETIVNDFPVRDRKLVLHIRRRRWLNEDGKSIVLNVYPLAVTGTRYSEEFAAFLKDKLGYDSRYGPFAGALVCD